MDTYIHTAWPGNPKTGESPAAPIPAAYSRYQMEVQLIKYIGNRKTPEGSTVYVFVINGLQKEIKEANIKQHPGCYEALPASAKEQITQNRQWMSKL